MKLDKAFYAEMLAIAVPIALQNLIASCLNTIDTLMVASLGAAAIAGVGLANQVFFLLVMLFFGINTGSSVMMAQYWGRRDSQGTRHILGLSLALCFLFGTIFTLVALFFPHFILSHMIHDPKVIQAGAVYLQVVSLSYIMTGLSFALGSALRTTGNPKTPLMASCASLFAQLFFNYVFIFGKLGFPRMGVAGAAVGTIAARLVELAIMAYVISTYMGPFNTRLTNLFNFNLSFIRQYFKVTLPVILNEGFWSLGQVMYSIAYAMVGTNATAAVQVCMAIQGIVFVIVRGLGSSCTIIIGRSIGQGLLEKVHVYAKRYLKLALLVGLTIGLFLSLTPGLTLLPFTNLSPQVYQLSSQLLRVMGVLFVMKAINSVIIIGILRGGGDTSFSMYLETFCVWAVGVPCALIAAAIFHWPIYGVMIMACMEDVCKILIGLHRVFSRKWVHQIS
ncbi:MATE family efflux transporter [Vaginisenegalia massiliensis]|uniref:MATE family efflux transporter n=1 Tax=Vaginisenegalia massiliensis TaxID=2058294 RepID=UPI000F53FE22|nr:MATE family efflux transporter [Vaginisenegalia massiliensis]